jgi:tetratricopeptide (TPR) repeat protein
MSTQLDADIAVVEVSIAKVIGLLKVNTPDAVDLLNVIAYLAPEDIPRRLLLHGSSQMPSGGGRFAGSPRNLSDAVAELNGYGLVQIVDSSLAIHRAWQDAVRQQLTPAEREKWAVAVGRMLLHQLPREFAHRDWRWLLGLLPHAVSAIDHLEHLGVAPELTAELRGRMAALQISQGEYAAAAETLDHALSLLEGASAHKRLQGTLLNTLAVAHRELGRPSSAEKLAMQALSLHRESPLTAASWADDAISAVSSTSAVTDAQSATEKSDPNDFEVAEDLHNLGIIYHRLGWNSDAVDLLWQAYGIRQRIFGEFAWEAADVLESLFSVYITEAMTDDAITVLRRAVEVRESRGDENIETQVTKQCLELLVESKSDEDIERRSRQILELIRTEYGESHPQVSGFLRSQGVILRNLSRLDEAQRAFQEANEIEIRNFGARYFRLAGGMIDEALLHAIRGDIDAATARLRDAILVVQQAPDDERRGVLRSALAENVEDFAQHGRPLIGKILPLLGDVGIDEPEVVQYARLFVVRTYMRAGDRFLFAGDVAAAAAQYEDGFQIAILTETPVDDAYLEFRLGLVSAHAGSIEDTQAHLRNAVHLMDGPPAHNFWWLAAQCWMLVACSPEAVELVQKCVDLIRAEVREGGKLTEIEPKLRVVIPDGWYYKESITLLSPDGRANVIASAEPLDQGVTTHEYAAKQGELLHEEFPQFEEMSFNETELFGGLQGYERLFAWTPPDGEPVTQMQYYATENGRGYTATATTETKNYDDLRVTLQQAMRTLRVLRNTAD